MVAAAVLAVAAAPLAAEAPSLSLPIDCEPGVDCYVQKYVDRDPGPGFVDVGCGALGDDGHNGTDFALDGLVDLRREVEVRAAAPGVVIGVRDGMPDIPVTDPAAPDLRGRDCGNGVNLDHGDGWTTQYCHLALGSIAVALDERVEAGQRLGLVGLSGGTEFPHLHFTVRRGDEIVDPYDATGGGCEDGSADALWAEPFDYVPAGLIAAGVLDRVPDYDEVKVGALGGHPGDAGAPLVLWGYAFGSRPGDVVRLVLDGPGGREIDQSQELEAEQVAYFRAGGRRAPEGGWPPGEYEGEVAILRDGEVVDRAPVGATISGGG